MRRLARGTLPAAACVLLAGCPEVARVDGTVTGTVGGYTQPARQLSPGDHPRPYTRVAVAGGASVTLRDGDCELTFTADFVMPSRLPSCDRDDEDRQDQDERQDDRGRDQARPEQRQEGQQPASEPEPAQQGAQPQAGHQGAQPQAGGQPAPSGTQGGGAGSAGGAAGQAAAAAARASLLQDALLALGGAVLAREAYEEIRGEDEPVSR